MKNTVMQRFKAIAPGGRSVKLKPDHEAAKKGRTLFPTRVFWPGFDNRVLKSGHNSRKIGAFITKGRWKGMPIYTLTLEERATCPRTCRQWLDCYGNNMHFAERFIVGDGALESRLYRELDALDKEHPDGFAVRLHVLGDFYSVEYVAQWALWLDMFPALHVFGYTAHHPHSDIGSLIARLSRENWERFAIRFSNAGLPERGAEVIDHDEDTDAIVCPAQTGKTDCCGTCGLCWQTRRNIAFLRH